MAPKLPNFRKFRGPGALSNQLCGSLAPKSNTCEAPTLQRLDSPVPKYPLMPRASSERLPPASWAWPRSGAWACLLLFCL